MGIWSDDLCHQETARQRWDRQTKKQRGPGRDEHINRSKTELTRRDIKMQRDTQRQRGQTDQETERKTRDIQTKMQTEIQIETEKARADRQR